jgi:MinD superfamily P-loop ATPase
MKQLVVLSGKGGTGKTSVSGAFAHLVTCNTPSMRAVFVDADVDAANLEFVLAPDILESFDFLGGQIAVIDEEICNGCGVCQSACRFEAIFEADGVYKIDQIACEGCAACMFQCPSEAIQMEPQTAGQWFHSRTKYGDMFHAALRPAQENSGKLVALVKEQARLFAMEAICDLVLVDGPPGIGCPVISAVSGADLALIVTEPTATGIHDLRRVLETINHFNVPALVCINKADIYSQGTDAIESFCREQGVEVVGKIPFDPAVTEAMVQGEPTPVYDPDTPASTALIHTWDALVSKLNRGF